MAALRKRSSGLSTAIDERRIIKRKPEIHGVLRKGNRDTAKIIMEKLKG